MEYIDLYNKGIDSLSEKDYLEAIKQLNKSYVLSNQRLNEALYCLGIAYENIGSFDDAEIHYIKYINIHKDSIKGWIHLGYLYYNNNNLLQAVDTFKMAIEIVGVNKQLHLAITEILIKLEIFNEAEYYYEQILGEIIYDQNNTKTYIFVLEILGKYNKAIETLEEFLVNNKCLPRRHTAELQCLLGFMNLKIGNYKNGFKLIENRWDTEKDAFKLGFDLSLMWNGSQQSAQCVKNKSLLLIWDQGLGDTIHFARYINSINIKFKNIYILCQKELKRLFISSFPGIKVFTKDDNLPKYDYFIPLMSLPFALKLSKSNLFNENTYIFPAYKKNRSSSAQKIIGIVWGGNKDSYNYETKSININEIEKLINRNNKHKWISLQYGFKDKIKNLKIILNDDSDFFDMCNVISDLDLVITVDTSVAHLAGAIGAPTWIMLSKNSCWRWGWEGLTTEWYKSVRLFRQKSFNNWNDVFNEITASLNH